MPASQKQKAIEVYMRDRAVARHRNRVQKAIDHRREAESTSAKYLIEDALGKYIEAIKEYTSTTGVKNALQAKIEHLQWDEVAALGIQAIMDGVSTGGLVITISSIVGKVVENEERVRAMWSTLEGHKRNRLERVIGRRVAPDLLSRTLSSMAREYQLDVEPWSQGDRIRLGHALVVLFVESTGLMEFMLQTKIGKGQRTYKHLVPTQETIAWLEASDQFRETLRPYYMPCTDLPVNWRKGQAHGGYHEQYIELVKVHGDRAKKIKDTDLGRVRAAVNFLQQTPWAINEDVLEVYRHCWEVGIEVEGVAPKDEVPIPEKPDTDDEDILSKWKADKYRAYTQNIQRRSDRLRSARIIWMADTYVNEGAFYFPWTCDFRGRVYPVSSILQPQGSKVERGLLQFADSKPLGTPEAERWFLIHGANSWGEDKVSFDDRIAWVKEHNDDIMAVYEDPIENMWWAEADRPWEFLAWALEYGDWVTDGLLHESSLAVGMDGSNNGLQIYSLLLRDPLCAKATNCVPVDQPSDIYQDVADLVHAEMLKVTEGDGAIWKRCFPDGLSRKAVKRPVMTYAYGVSKYSSSHYVREWLREQRPKLPMYDEIRRDDLYWLYDTVWDKIQLVVSSAKACMDWLQECAHIFNKAGHEITWVSPSDFPVMPKYPKRRQKTIKLRTRGNVHVMKWREDSPGMDPRRHTNSIAPNWVHSLDAAALVGTVEICRVEGVSHLQMIHDSFATHAADAPVLARSLRQAYIELFTPDLLDDMLRQMQAQAPAGVKLPEPPRRGELEVAGLSEADYFFA